MQRHDNESMGKWVAMKAIVLVLVVCAVYLVFINPPHREVDKPPLTREQLDSQSDTITELAEAKPEPVLENPVSETNDVPAVATPTEEVSLTESQSNTLAGAVEAAVSYTHLTLPTIYSV